MAIEPASFFTFGMFILDEIEWLDSFKPPVYNLIGGAGTYAVLGARLASSSCQRHAKNISWIVDEGSDFPAMVKTTLQSWKTDCYFRLDKTRLTTRAWNGYGKDEFRSFRYSTPKKRLEVADLNERQLLSASFHMVCSPERCIDICSKLQERRIRLHQESDRAWDVPVIVWEPIPDLCSPAELLRLQQAAQNCTVVSPNAEELRMFFVPELTKGKNDMALVKQLMGWSKQMVKTASVVCIIREGANGSTGYMFDQIEDRIRCVHLPAYHTQDMQSSIVDPTGGGNTYLGALALTLTDAVSDQSTHTLIGKYLTTRTTTSIAQIIVAMLYATVAASFVLEQHGVPSLERSKDSKKISEHWNGEQFIDRLEAYLKRELKPITEQIDDTQQSQNSMSRKE